MLAANLSQDADAVDKFLDVEGNSIKTGSERTFKNNLTGANGYKFSALDTTLVTYAAIAAYEAKRPDDGAIYYRKLADANVSDPQYLDVYQVLAD